METLFKIVLSSQFKIVLLVERMSKLNYYLSQQKDRQNSLIGSSC